MQVRKQQLELDMEQQTDSKYEKILSAPGKELDPGRAPPVARRWGWVLVAPHCLCSVASPGLALPLCPLYSAS